MWVLFNRFQEKCYGEPIFNCSTFSIFFRFWERAWVLAINSQCNTDVKDVKAKQGFLSLASWVT